MGEGNAALARPCGGIFGEGEVVRTVPESEIVETLIGEAFKLAGRDGAEALGE